MNKYVIHSFVVFLFRADDSETFWDTVPGDLREELEASIKQGKHLDVGETIVGEGK
jgi:hypothetical protein